MIIDCIADLHGYYPKLEGGDLLIVAGDLTTSDQPYQYEFLYDILKEKLYKKIILIAGNHDSCLQNGKVEFVDDDLIEYLCDSGTEFEELKIWGSPWTLTFPGINPHCTAFTGTEDYIADKFELIPHNTDILITHGPPKGILDTVQREVFCGEREENTGSESLSKAIERVMPELVIFGHIHENGGQYVQKAGVLYINGSIVDERYRNVNTRRRIIFDEKMPKMQRFKVVK